jgi:hypothetical protein
MILECHKCQAKVDAKELAKHGEGDPDFPTDEYRYFFLECPVCKATLVASMTFLEYDQNKSEEVWSDPVREWPSPDISGDPLLPKIVATSLQEARKCFKATCYLACTVMCGRSLEGICVSFQTKSKNLSLALDELLDREIIDKKLHKWGQATRRLRNMAAHATEEVILKEDALDLLEFTKAICDYVFVLTKRFDDFMKRNEGRKKKSASPPPAAPGGSEPSAPAPAIAADEPPELEAEPA